MKEVTPSLFACPRCNYQLVPVHAIEDRKRRIIALTCPEPYCDHMQMITRRDARRLERTAPALEAERILRAAN